MSNSNISKNAHEISKGLKKINEEKETSVLKWINKKTCASFHSVPSSQMKQSNVEMLPFLLWGGQPIYWFGSFVFWAGEEYMS